MLSFPPFAVCAFDKENKRFIMVVDSKQASVPELTDYMQPLNLILWQSYVNSFNSQSLCTASKWIQQLYRTNIFPFDSEGSFSLWTWVIFWLCLSDCHQTFKVLCHLISSAVLCSCAPHTPQHNSSTATARKPRHVRQARLAGKGDLFDQNTGYSWNSWESHNWI